MNKLFWKYFGTYTLRTGAVCLIILTLVVLGNWFTDLSFPYYMFQWDAEDRSNIFITTTMLVGLCAMFGWISAENNLREDKHNTFLSKLTPKQLEAHEKLMYDLQAGMRTQYQPTPKKSKGLDAADIAVGVASGVVIGEVINDLLE